MLIRTIGLSGMILVTGCVNDATVLSEADQPGENVTSSKLSSTDTGEDAAQTNTQDSNMTATDPPTKYNKLTEFEEHVIVGKGTERAFVGEYTDTEDPGTYICRRCNAPLYQSEHKFHSNCGWPAFDDEIKGAVRRTVDADGYRVEITCANCDGHLGHVFEGEQFTEKNTRHCVNSVSMVFVPKGQEIPATIKPEK